MDIALLSMALSQGKAQQDASMLVMKKAMGTAEQQGDALQKLMSSADATTLQNAAQPHLGGNIDIKL